MTVRWTGKGGREPESGHIKGLGVYRKTTALSIHVGVENLSLV
jgi:hypothetical protein